MKNKRKKFKKNTKVFLGVPGDNDLASFCSEVEADNTGINAHLTLSDGCKSVEFSEWLEWWQKEADGKPIVFKNRFRTLLKLQAALDTHIEQVADAVEFYNGIEKYKQPKKKKKVLDK